MEIDCKICKSKDVDVLIDHDDKMPIKYCVCKSCGREFIPAILISQNERMMKNQRGSDGN